MTQTRPKHLRAETTRHGKTVYYLRKPGCVRTRLPDEHGTDEFWDAYEKALAGVPILSPKQMRARKTRVEIEASVLLAWKNAKNRATQKGMEFSITQEWALSECRANNYRCSMTGVPFMMRRDRKMHKRPYVPSIDRIDCKRGYTPDNVRLVIFAVNLMMAEWGEDVMRQVMVAYAGWKNKTRRDSRRTEIECGGTGCWNRQKIRLPESVF
jgi:hypothetical protein